MVRILFLAKMRQRKKKRERKRERERKRTTTRAKKRGLKHFSHDHPLILNEGHDKDDGWEVSCYGCVQPISAGGPSYGCIPCQFFLHKSCAELPREMTHPSHPEHPLTLLPNPPNYYGGYCICDVCRETFNRFIYHCRECRFDVDISCASIVQSIQQKVELRNHGHLLMPLRIPAMFMCNACGIKHEGTSYLCTTCGFWADQKCASLPSKVKLRRHDHPLALIYSLPYEYRHGSTCKICHHKVYRRSWVYYCSRCMYFVHLNCATSETTEECKLDIEQEDLDHNLIEFNSVTSGKATSNTELSKAKIKAKDLDSNLITLPVPDESVDTMTKFIKYIRLRGKCAEATEIMHVSHDHPLILSNKKIEDESCSGSKLPLSNEVLMKNDDDEDEKCNGCAQTISMAAPFYHCAEDQCSKFYLHQWCAELPTELRHPCHLEHPLRLITQQQPSSTNFHLHKCENCRLLCNVFVFGCSACDFYLDSNCAFLPRIIRHEAHKHTLALRQSGSRSCSACNTRFYRLAFVCDLCKLNLCSGCAFLPGSVRHRYDEHPFTITYSPLKDQPDEYYCEICDEEIMSKYWFYHCLKCDQSLHTKCIRPPLDEKSNIKYGVTFDIGKYHPHPLTSVPSPKDNSSSCGICGHSFLRKYDYMALQCAPCNIWIHYYHVK